MQIDYESRIVRMGVGELAEFRLGPRDSGSREAGRWRMELGSQWHKRLQTEEAAKQAVTGGTEPRFEVVVTGTVIHEGWRFELNGRIDQVITDGARKVLREVKTVSHPLPMREDKLRGMYPGYFAQVGAYRVLCGLNPESGLKDALAELVFVDCDEGTRQIVPVDDEMRSHFDAQIALVWEFAESRRTSRARVLSADIAPPFEAERIGQAGAEKSLYEASLRSKIVLWEAPTGFGKTAYALYNALTRMKSGLFDRAIYVTGRSTGQLQVVKEISRRWANVVRCQQMRSHAEHAIRSPMHTCGESGSCRDGIEEAWRRAGINPARIAANGPLELADARALGESTGVCPFEITRSVLPFSDVWIGDYNYVFHPRACGVFMEQPGFDAKRTLLIIDEAHNIPPRVADAWSASLEARHLEDLSVELSFAHPEARLRRSLDSLQSFVSRLNKCDRQDDTVLYEVRDLLRGYVDAMQAAPIDAEALRPGAMEALWELADAVGPLENENLELLLWSKERGRLEITCLDASREIAARLKEFGGVLMMSATLRPLDNLLAACGLDAKQAEFIRSVAPWRGMGYEVAVDCRVDTRLKARPRSMPLTAETIADICGAAKGPVAAIFPSYKYAQDVADALSEVASLRVALQPRGLDLEGQRLFVEDSLAGVDVLMLVLGTGFTEGIDALGGKVSHAVVVSPALPEADAVQSARMEAARGASSVKAFHDVYMVPGIRKVNQAMGRLVRAPGQSAKVLLHCRRFSEPDYTALLDEDFRPQEAIASREDLLRWLGK
jgi:DNA excision repair protein ERCC-2